MNKEETEAGTVADRPGDEDGGELGLTCNSFPFDTKTISFIREMQQKRKKEWLKRRHTSVQ